LKWQKSEYCRRAVLLVIIFYRIVRVLLYGANKTVSELYNSLWGLETVGPYRPIGASICKCLRSPGIDSKESIPPAYVAWRAGTSNRVVVPARPGWESIPGLLKRFTNSGSGYLGWRINSSESIPGLLKSLKIPFQEML
jgi:hypothetical protein